MSMNSPDINEIDLAIEVLDELARNSRRSPAVVKREQRRIRFYRNPSPPQLQWSLSSITLALTWTCPDPDRGLELAVNCPWSGNARERSAPCPYPRISRALAWLVRDPPMTAFWPPPARGHQSARRALHRQRGSGTFPRFRNGQESRRRASVRSAPRAFQMKGSLSNPPEALPSSETPPVFPANYLIRTLIPAPFRRWPATVSVWPLGRPSDDRFPR